MAKIVSDFSGLPLETDLAAAALYQLIYYQLARMGLALPASTADSVTRVELLALLQAHAGAILKVEIATDPMAVGYAGKTDVQICDLIQSFRPVANEGPTRLSVIWEGLPLTPNAIVPADVTAAKV
jgi:hypothetical protein